MRKRIRRTVSLPAQTSTWLDEVAEAEQTSASGIVRSALQLYRIERTRRDLGRLQQIWSTRAIQRGVFTEHDLEQYAAHADAPAAATPFEWDD